MNPEFLESVLEALNGSNAQYFKIENSKKKIEIIRKKDKFVPVQTTASIQESQVRTEGLPEKEEIQDNYFDITSPYVGFFHRGSVKDSKPIIKLREVVEEGQLVAYIYSMSVQYEVKVDKRGKLVEVLIEDGQAVEYGQPLFRLKPADE